jgi:hypothetical protein
MRLFISIFILAFVITGCAKTTPLPTVDGSTVRALNPTKWNYQNALKRKQTELGSRWFNDLWR